MDPADLTYFWVEHRDDLGAGWERHESLPVRWPDAVDQLRHAAEAALTGTDDDEHEDDVTVECREVLAAIDQGLLTALRCPDSPYSSRYLRIVPAGPSLGNRLAAELRFWVIEHGQGLATVTITTCSGRTIDGTVAWEDIRPDAVTLTASGRTTVLRPARIESFTVDPHSARRAS